MSCPALGHTFWWGVEDLSLLGILHTRLLGVSQVPPDATQDTESPRHASIHWLGPTHGSRFAQLLPHGRPRHVANGGIGLRPTA